MCHIRCGKEKLIITYQPLICFHCTNGAIHVCCIECHSQRLNFFPAILTCSEVPSWLGPSLNTESYNWCWKAGAPLKWSHWFCNCSSSQGWKPGNKRYWPTGFRNSLISLLLIHLLCIQMYTMTVSTNKHFPYIIVLFLFLNRAIIMTYCWCSLWMIQ